MAFDGHAFSARASIGLPKVAFGLSYSRSMTTSPV